MSIMIRLYKVGHVVTITGLKLQVGTAQNHSNKGQVAFTAIAHMNFH